MEYPGDILDLALWRLGRGAGRHTLFNIIPGAIYCQASSGLEEVI